MLNVKLSKKQLKVLVENINNDIDYTYRLCKQSVDKKIKDSPWCELKNISYQVSDVLNKQLQETLNTLLNFFPRHHTGILPNIIKISQQDQNRTISFLKTIADFINDPLFSDDQSKKTLQNFKTLDEIPSNLEDLLKVVRAKEYSNYENSFVGNEFTLKRGMLKLDYKCGDLTETKNFFEIIKKINQDSNLASEYCTKIIECVKSSINNINIPQKGDLITKSPLYVIENGVNKKIFEANSFFEVKKMDVEIDSYLSEFFSIFKSTDLKNLKPEYIQTYNKVMSVLYMWIKSNGNEFLNNVRKSINGIIYDKNIIVPTENIEFYWSNKGQRGCDELRLSIRFRIKPQITKINGYKYINGSNILENFVFDVKQKDTEQIICK